MSQRQSANKQLKRELIQISLAQKTKGTL